MNKGYRHAPPKAGAMLEALRGLGYSTSTALADIVDNSIAAGASIVEIFFNWSGSVSTISVLDNGAGMDSHELDRAMRLGDRNPLDTRSSEDLGRFGLGLKTASFSQCRRLTVASVKQGHTDCLRWDLDVLASSTDDGWHLLEGPAPGSEDFLNSLHQIKNGTLVLWEQLDRIVTPGCSEQDFLDLIDRVESHLAMVFHRYLSGPKIRLTLKMNGQNVIPWDPFLIFHQATWSSPVERLRCEGSIAEVQCHVLPHKDRLEQKIYDLAAGPDGWTAQQGFYVYRNQRLLVAGSWLGLGQGRCWTKEEAHRLARIRLDIPNTADADWKIDIRKSTARPPLSIRARLTRLAEDTRARARRVFAHRGKPALNGKEPVAQAWLADRSADGLRYRIDTSHPAVSSVLEEAGMLLPQIKAMLRVIEETVPIQRIWLDTTEEKEAPRTGFDGAADSDVMAVLTVMYRNLVIRKGYTPALARAKLIRTEPFNNYPTLVSTLPDDLPESESEI